jgi:hypothetical protein
MLTHGGSVVGGVGFESQLFAMAGAFGGVYFGL